MGAVGFEQRAQGHSAADAFAQARTQAQYDHGHSGYTGTIAEKHEFEIVEVPAGYDPEDFVDMVQRAVWYVDDRKNLFECVGKNETERLMDLAFDKWGPAIAVQISSGNWVFFGSASC